LNREWKLKLQLSESEKETLQERVQKEQAEKDKYRIIAEQTSSTTEQALARGEDEMSNAFDNAQIVTFWLPDCDTLWEGPWGDFAISDDAKNERDFIQPAIIHQFAPEFPTSSPYCLEDTHKGRDHMTMDAVLLLKDVPPVSCHIAAIFEWVGQNEKGWPSKPHKAKFIRDCIRLSKACGGDRVINGAVSDLSRIVAVRYLGMIDGKIRVEKTVVRTDVQIVLSSFAAAAPEQLSVVSHSWQFEDRKVYSERFLGHGIHGRVHLVEKNCFLKDSTVETCRAEVETLRRLENHKVRGVPREHGVSVDGKAFIGSPVGKSVFRLQKQVIVYRVGAQLLECLRETHKAGIFHGDVRPSNVVFLAEKNKELEVLLCVVVVGMVGVVIVVC
jgi:hypothetical protein